MSTPLLRPLLLALLLVAPALGETKPAATEVDFPSLESVVQLIPADLKLKKGGGLDPVTAAVASEAMNTKTKDKKGQVRFKVWKMDPEAKHGQKYRLRSDHFPVQIRGESVECVVVAYFAAAQGTQFAQVKIASTVVVTGTFLRADVAPPDVADYRDKLLVVLKDCQIVSQR